MEYIESFRADLMAGSPDWMLIWLQAMLGVIAVTLLFGLIRHEARHILFGTALGLAMMLLIYGQFGYSRILGVGPILFWTPTLFYMYSLQGTSTVAKTWFGRWLWIATAAMTVSLAWEYMDLVRYLFGDRDPLGL